MPNQPEAFIKRMEREQPKNDECGFVSLSRFYELWKYRRHWVLGIGFQVQAIVGWAVYTHRQNAFTSHAMSVPCPAAEFLWRAVP